MSSWCKAIAIQGMTAPAPNAKTAVIHTNGHVAGRRADVFRPFIGKPSYEHFVEVTAIGLLRLDDLDQLLLHWCGFRGRPRHLVGITAILTNDQAVWATDE
jgi:hypothetical protein